MDDQSQEFCGLTARLHFEYEYGVPLWKLDQFEIPSGNDVLESYGRRKGRRKDKSAKKAKKADKEQLNDTKCCQPAICIETDKETKKILCESNLFFATAITER